MSAARSRHDADSRHRKFAFKCAIMETSESRPDWHPNGSLTPQLDSTERELAMKATHTLFCQPYEGEPSNYQRLAERTILNYTELTQVLPWTWYSTMCPTPQCLFSAHIVVNSPVKIAYAPYVCIYCGRAAGTKDHLLPSNMTGPTIRRSVAIVPACRECNSAINDLPDYRITVRRARAHKYLLKKYGKFLRATCSTDQLEGWLLEHVKSAHKNEGMVKAMLSWPGEIDYDVRAFQRSGIEDPIAMGLI